MLSLHIIHRTREFLYIKRLNDSSKCVNNIEYDRSSIQTIFVPFLKYATKMQPEKNRNRHVRFDYRFVSLNNTIINEIQDARNFGLSPEWKDWICISKRETINWKSFVHRSLTKIYTKLIKTSNETNILATKLRKKWY